MRWKSTCEFSPVQFAHPQPGLTNRVTIALWMQVWICQIKEDRQTDERKVIQKCMSSQCNMHLRWAQKCNTAQHSKLQTGYRSVLEINMVKWNNVPFVNMFGFTLCINHWSFCWLIRKLVGTTKVTGTTFRGHHDFAKRSTQSCEMLLPRLHGCRPLNSFPIPYNWPITAIIAMCYCLQKSWRR